MSPLLILIVAMIVVIGGVVALRLHAFLALLFGALIVALLSSTETVFQTEVRNVATRVLAVEGDELTIKTARKQTLFVGPSEVYREDSDAKTLVKISNARVEVVTKATEDTAATCQVSNLQFESRDETQSQPSKQNQIEPGDFLLSTEQVHHAKGIAASGFANRIATGFGNTCGKIGILIAMAAVVGVCLLESGAAERIVLAIRNRLGEKRSPVAFALSGFVVGIPVFFDTVFYLLLPLAKAMYRKTGKDYLLYVLSVVVGASMAHSLVPPTPGPLFVAGELSVNLGKMIIAGSIVGLLAVTAGFGYVLLANRWWQIPLREESPHQQGPSIDEISDRTLPPLTLSVLPILIPVVLLSGKTIFGKQLQNSTTAAGQTLDTLVQGLGNPNVALIIAAVLAMYLVVRFQSNRSNDSDRSMASSIQNAMSSAGSVILITAIGGAFGHVLRQTGIAVAIQQQFPASTSGTMLLCVAFAITAVVRVAQGSATVAMITSIGIVGPLASSMELAFDPVYLALAIGCGSKPLPWMNDSGFWVVGKMSGMTERETLSTLTVTLTVMGIVGFLITLAGATWLPLKGG